MKKQLMLFVLVISLTTIWFSSCDETPSTGTTDPAAANEKAAQAYTEMENIFAAPGSLENKNFSNVERLYMEAVAADPGNPTANFGAAFSHILATLSDTAIKNTIKRWEGAELNIPSSMLRFGIPTGTKDMIVPTEILGKNLVKMIQTATSEPPTITEMQNLIRDRILPRVNYAIARMAIVEQNQNFEMRISGKMQGGAGAKDVYLDLTEVYIMDAMLQSMKASIEQFLVFKFELSGYTSKAAVVALQQNNLTFFVLASDGTARAQSIKSSLLAAVGKIRGSVNFLKGETDNQDDDIIKRGNSGIAVKDLDTVLAYLTKIETALTGTFSVELKDADSDNNDYTVQISLNNFFSSLPQYPKQAWFPTYSVDTTANGDLQWHWFAVDYASFTFPDPTFSGLFPGMTNETLKRLLRIDEEFAWRVDVYIYDNFSSPPNATVQINVNGTIYTPKSSDYWGQYKFLIQNNNGQQVQSINIVKDGLNVPVEFVGATPAVRLKNHDYINIDLTRAPQNITAQHNSLQSNISVNLRQYAFYRIERSVNNGAFVKVDSSYTVSYTDINISPGTTYSYRASRSVSYYSWNYMATRSNNYTNTVSVTTP